MDTDIDFVTNAIVNNEEKSKFTALQVAARKAEKLLEDLDKLTVLPEFYYTERARHLAVLQEMAYEYRRLGMEASYSELNKYINRMTSLRVVEPRTPTITERIFGSRLLWFFTGGAVGAMAMQSFFM